jgi:hypothetical protein
MIPGPTQNQDQVRKGKSEDRPRHPTGARGAQAPRGGQGETRGTPEENLSLERSPKDTRETPRRKTKLHLILNCTYQKTPRLGPVDATVVTVVLKRNRPCRWGIPPLVGETHLRDPLNLMNMRQRCWTLNRASGLPRRGKDRSYLPDPPTACEENKDGVQAQRRKQIPGSGTDHGNTAAARGTPARNHRRQRPKRPHWARQEAPCVPDPEIHLTEVDPRPFPRRQGRSWRPNQQTPGPR